MASEDTDSDLLCRPLAYRYNLSSYTDSEFSLLWSPDSS